MSESGKKNLSPGFCEIAECLGIPGYPVLVQRHRIIPGREGGKYKKGNVISLCGSHHVLADRGYIPADELLEIVRLRLEKEQLEKQTVDNIDHERAESDQGGGSDTPQEPDESFGDGSGDAADGLQPEPVR